MPHNPTNPMQNLKTSISCVSFPIFDRRHDFVLGCAQLICSRHHVQLLFCCTVWTGCSTEIGERQEKYYRYSNGECGHIARSLAGVYFLGFFGECVQCSLCSAAECGLQFCFGDSIFIVSIYRFNSPSF